jgi:hypothetical protein
VQRGDRHEVELAAHATVRNPDRRMDPRHRMITPQAMRSPLFPPGSVL